jgi:hypothetical protein
VKILAIPIRLAGKMRLPTISTQDGVFIVRSVYHVLELEDGIERGYHGSHVRQN